MPLPILSDEIYANIFDHLECRDLHVVMMASKNLSSIAKAVRHDQQLFRSNAGLVTTSRLLPADFTLHPILTTYKFTCDPKMNSKFLKMCIDHASAETNCLLSTTNTLDNYAGSPPPSYVGVHCGTVSIYTYKQQGLTVDRVMHAMCATILHRHIWSSRIGYTKSSFATEAEVDSFFYGVPRQLGGFRWKVLEQRGPAKGLNLVVYLLEWPGDEAGVGEWLDIWAP